MNRRQRSGISLFELMVVISISTVLLGMTATWIHQTMKFSARIKKRQNDDHQLFQLASRFREHAYSADSAKIENAGELTLSSGKTRWVYQIVDSQINETEYSDGDVVRRQRYELANDLTPIWNATELPHRIGLTVYRQSPHSTINNSAESPPEISSPVPQAIESGAQPVVLHMLCSIHRWSSGRPVSNLAPGGNSEGGSP